MSQEENQHNSHDIVHNFKQLLKEDTKKFVDNIDGKILEDLQEEDGEPLHICITALLLTYAFSLYQKKRIMVRDERVHDYKFKRPLE